MITFLKIIAVVFYMFVVLLSYSCCRVAKDGLDDAIQAKWCKIQRKKN